MTLLIMKKIMEDNEKKKLCIICGKNEATIPDRNNFPSRKKEICENCHLERLRNDMIAISDRHKQKEIKR